MQVRSELLVGELSWTNGARQVETELHDVCPVAFWKVPFPQVVQVRSVTEEGGVSWMVPGWQIRTEVHCCELGSCEKLVRPSQFAHMRSELAVAFAMTNVPATQEETELH